MGWVLGKVASLGNIKVTDLEATLLESIKVLVKALEMLQEVVVVYALY